MEQVVKALDGSLHIGEVVIDSAEYDKIEKDHLHFNDGIVARHEGGDVWSLWNSDGDHYEEWVPGTMDPVDLRALIDAAGKEDHNADS